ncbi:Vacuolar protein sorting-associated protein 8-like protein [Trichoplax sp. H2]|nr:Vacuolar protein sorting-associated protein 8-like protein [Trichoplax sp. H2]|eukprot:RDD46317.1 Vacuolar protein sorting-associated protein 8-like protein [Trichoplax sp. H2]
MTALPDFSQDYFNSEEELQTADEILQESNEADPFLIDLENDVASLAISAGGTTTTTYDPASDLTSLLEADDDIPEDFESDLQQVDNLPSLDSILQAPDDFEAELPAMQDLPTLDSILNESVDDPFLTDELGFDIRSETSDNQSAKSGHSNSESGASTSAAPFDSRRRHKSHGKKLLVKHDVSGSIVKVSKLQTLTAQICKKSSVQKVGAPTVVALSSLVAIGTMNGLTLVFDLRENLKHVLGGKKSAIHLGSVTAVDFNTDGSRLLTGYQNGQIFMWDTQKGEIIRNLTSAHPPLTVLQLKFTDDPTLAIFSDASGSAYTLSFTRKMGIRGYNKRIIVDGSDATVCSLEPLHIEEKRKNHRASNLQIVAMTTLLRIVFVALKPEPKVLLTIPIKADEDDIPALSWQFSLIKTDGNSEVMEPVLAVGRGQMIVFYQIVLDDRYHIRLFQLKKLGLPVKLSTIHWMTPHLLVIVDVNRKARVIYIKSEEQLEIIDTAAIELVTPSYLRSSTSVEGISERLIACHRRAFFSTVVSFRGEIALAGTKAIYVLRLRTWKERIDYFVELNKYSEALAQALAFYDDRAKCTIGLPSNDEQRQTIIADEIIKLLSQFVDSALQFIHQETVEGTDTELYFADHILPTCLDYCIMINRTDFLFGEIYGRFIGSVQYQELFLESMEPYILADKLVCLSPIVMKDFVGKEMLDRVEQCILHLQVTSMDFHQIVNLCWTYGLYDAIIYVYAQGLKDYMTPVEELYKIIRNKLNSGVPILTDKECEIGYKLLVFISSCLAGRAYPVGRIDDDLAKIVKSQVFHFLILKTVDDRNERKSYPRFRTFLKFDSREFLNVLALAFEDEDFGINESGFVAIDGRQLVIDILLEVMLEPTQSNVEEIRNLFTFIARQVAKPQSNIIISSHLIDQVLEYLCNAMDKTRMEERQQALLDLLVSGCLRQYNEEKLLYLAESARFYQVCQVIYEQKGQLANVLSCYWRDDSRKDLVFDYINGFLQDEKIIEFDRVEMKKIVLAHIEDLLSVDNIAAARLLAVDFKIDLPTLMIQLMGESKVLFSLLDGIYNGNTGVLATKSDIVSDPESHEKYIELLCRYNPGDVYPHLKAIEGYRPEVALKICRQFKVMNATAYLLELIGEIEEAFHLIIKDFNEKFSELTKACRVGNLSRENMDQSITQTESMLHAIVKFCKRGSNKIVQARREAIWFELLDVVLVPQAIKENFSQDSIEVFMNMANIVLNNMMGFISIPQVLRKIMMDSSYNSKFGDIKSLILGLLDTYIYEETLLTSTIKLLSQDLYTSLRSFEVNNKKGIQPGRFFCEICRRTLLSDKERLDDEAAVFNCGHMFHIKCLEISLPSRQFVCILCAGIRSTSTGSISLSRQQSTTNSVGFESNSKRSSKSLGLAEAFHNTVDNQKLKKYEHFIRTTKTSSKIAMLAELSKARDGVESFSDESRLISEDFKLKSMPQGSFDLSRC